MKTSLKNLAAEMKPGAKKGEGEHPSAVLRRPFDSETPPPTNTASYPTAQTREGTRQLSGHYPADDVQAFRILAAEQDKDVQELLAEAMNMAFERYGKSNRVPVTSGRRTKSRR
jgi:hypothetical protein